MYLLHRTARSAVVVVSGLLAGSTWAADTSPTEKDKEKNGGLEEIVVTAQKRSERLQDVPIAMSVTTQEQIERDQIYSLNDLQRLSPALEINRTFGGETNGGGRIRGIGTASFSGVGSVAFIIDGIAQGDVAQTNIFDIAQVEVLRGPQGTLFGQNASAGVINQTTVAPDPSKVEGNAHVDLSFKGKAGSDFGRQSVRGALNLPLGSESAIRIALFGTETKGSQHNTFNNQDNKFDDAGIRVRYLTKLGSNLTVNLIGDYTGRREYGGDFFTAAVAPDPMNGDTALLAACGIKPGFGNQNYCYPLMSGAQYKNWGLSAKLDWDLSGYTLTSVSALRRWHLDTDRFQITRLIGGIPDIFTRNQAEDRDQVVQELRITSPTGSAVDYVAGLYYSESFHRTHPYAGGGGFNLIFPWPNSAPPCVFGGACSLMDAATISDSTNTAVAGFADATWHLASTLKAFGGLRYTRQTLDGSATNAFTGVKNSGSTDDNNVSGRLGAAYNFSHDLMLYSSISRGYKSPFFQVPSDPTIAPTFIRGEKPVAYEIGFKGSFLDNKLGIDANVFYQDVKDFQGQQCTLNPATQALNCLALNIPSVISKGLELDVLGQPARNLRLNAGFIYNPVEYPSNWTGSDGTDISHKQLALAPLYKLTLSSEYSVPFSAWEIFFSLNPVWKSKIRFNDSADPVYDYPQHWQVGATLGLRGVDNKWSLSLFGRNLTSEHEPTVIFGPHNGGTLQGWPNADVTLRQVGLSFDLKFGK